MSKRSVILDANGQPFRTGGKKPRRDLADALNDRRVRARYDAAQTLQDTSHHWASADALDADSANSREVRSKLVQRSRYETWNNGYTDGIASTYATHLVGVGPVLRMQTESEGFNRMVELAWFNWTKAIQFRRKLWCMAHAKHVDGEGLGVLRINRGIRHPVPLDVRLYESEHCQTPYLPFGVEGYIDGIQFDEFGNPTFYDILRRHPGSIHDVMLDLVPERVPADRVLHWFKMRRPGQHRGIPDNTSTLNLGAAARRWRESTLTHAEMIAKLTVLLKSLMNPAEEDADPVTAMSTLELLTGTMVALPNTVEPVQLDAKQPAATYEMFHRSLVNEQARPSSMPYNVAAADSSSYNYASGRLDHQTYYAHLDVDREDANDLVLDPLFETWFDLAVMRFRWLGGNPEAVSGSARAHVWDWPKHRVADVESEANANRTKLESGQTGLYRLYSDAGMDAEDEIEKEAQLLGLPVADLKKRIVDVLYPPAQQPQAPAAAPSEEAVAAVFRNLQRRGLLNGKANGHAHQ